MRGLRRKQRTWLHNPDRRSSLGSTTVSARNPNLRGDHPAAHGVKGGTSTKKQGVVKRKGNKVQRKKGKQIPKRVRGQEEQVKLGLLALNVCGLLAIRSKVATNLTPEAGDMMKYEPSDKLRQVLSMMKAQGVKVAVLSDTHHDKEQAEAVAGILMTMVMEHTGPRGQ